MSPFCSSVFVAMIPPDRAPDRMPQIAQRMLDFNAALPAIVNALKAQGKDVKLVDQFTPLNANFNSLMVVDNVLNLHPNAAGNNVIAQQWFNAIEARAVPEPGSATLIGAAVAFLLRRRRRA